MSNKPVMSVSFKRGEQSYNVLSVWRGSYAGTYSVSRDKGSERYPAISVIEVIKALAAGDGFVNVRVASQADAAPRSGGGGGAGFADERGHAQDFAEDDIPFATCALVDGIEPRVKFGWVTR